jgi:adenylate kinase family enzyme
LIKVSDGLMIRLVIEEISRGGCNKLLLDGFPRTVPQVYLT